MVTISILYPQTPGATFDIAYYLQTHMPMSLARLRSHPGFIALSVERGMAAPGSDIAPAYVAMCHYRFRTADDFVAAFTPHALELHRRMTVLWRSIRERRRPGAASGWLGARPT